MRKLPLLALAATVSLAAGALVAPPALASSSFKVSIGDNFFSPAKKTIKRKTKVKWTWKGVAPHNVTLIKAPSAIKESKYADYGSDTQTTGTFSKRLKISGKYTFVCTIHSDMVLKIKVTKST
jgi:plastocyanin